MIKKVKFSVIVVLCVALVIIMGLLGCKTTTAETTAAKSSEGTTLAVSIRTLTNPYFVENKDGCEQLAKSLGLKSAILVDDGSSEKELNDIKALVASTGGNVVFFIDPNNATDVVAIAKTLEAAGVYFCTWWNKPDDLKVWDYKYYVAHMSFDGLYCGEFTATELFKTFKTPNQGKIIALQGMLSNSIAQDLFKGLNNALAKNPGVKLVAQEAADWDQTKAYEKTKSMLVANPDIDGVWAANDMMGLGAIQALKEAGLAVKVKVTGLNGVDEFITAIKNGEAAATQYTDGKYNAGLSLSFALAAKTGKIDVTTLPKEHRQFFVSAVDITAANVNTIVKSALTYDLNDFFGKFTRAMP